MSGTAPGEKGECCSVCRSVCTPLDEVTLEAAIHRLTRALVTADDATIGALVEERRAIRAELAELRRADGSAVRLPQERTRGR